jgi:hypothetical protein
MADLATGSGRRFRRAGLPRATAGEVAEQAGHAARGLQRVQSAPKLVEQPADIGNGGRCAVAA